MSLLDDIEEHCSVCGIEIERMPLPGDIKAIYYSTPHTCPAIALDTTVKTRAETASKLAEELGHHYTTHGDILMDPSIPKETVRKVEAVARRWAFRYAVSLSGIIESWDAGARTRHEMAEALEVEEQFLAEALETYEAIYGPFTIYGNTMIAFNPLAISR